MQTPVRHESLRITLLNAYALTVVARICDVLFFLGLFASFQVEEVGLFSWTVAIVAFFAIALELGLSQTVVRGFNREAQSFTSAALPHLLIRLPILIVGTVGYVLWAWLWAVPAEEYTALGLAGSIQVLMVGESYCLGWLKAKSHQSAANLIQTLDPVGRLLVFGIVVYGLQRGGVIELLSGLLGLHLILLVTTVMLTLRLARREEGSKSSGRAPLVSSSTLFRSGATLGLIGLVVVVQNRLDWLLVSTYVGKVELASYSLANKAYEMLVLFIGVAMLTAYPWMCRRDTSRLFQMKVSIVLLSMLTCGTTAALGFALYLPDLLSSVWGNKYEEARPLLQLLLPVAALSTAIVILYYQLVARERERAILVISLVSTGLQLLVNLWLIPRVGTVGAVAGMATLALVNLFCYCPLARRAGILSVDQMWRAAVFLAAMFSFAFLLWRFRIPLQWGSLALTAIGLSAGCSILLPRREQRWLWGFVKRASWARVQLRTGEAS